MKLSPTLNQHAIRLTCRECLSRFDVRAAMASTVPRKFTFRGLISTSGRLLPVAKRILKLYGALRFDRRRVRKAVSATKVLVRAYALFGNPLDSGRHVAYAEELRRIGAFGLASLHYKQALRLDATNQNARQGGGAAGRDHLTAKTLASYFVSFSDAAGPRRPIREHAIVTAQKIAGEDFPDIQAMESDRRMQTG